MFDLTADLARGKLSAFNSLDGVLIRVQSAIGDACKDGRAMCAVRIDNIDPKTLMLVQRALRDAGYYTKSTAMTTEAAREQTLTIGWGGL